MKPREWIARVAEGPRTPDVYRLNGWLIATDGRIVLAIPDDGEPATGWVVAGLPTAPLAPLFVDAPDLKEFRLSDLRKQIKAPPRTMSAAYANLSRRARVGNAIVNARLLAFAVAGAPGKTVGIGPSGDDYEPINLRGDGWRGLVMPLRSDPDADAEGVEWVDLGIAPLPQRQTKKKAAR